MCAYLKYEYNYIICWLVDFKDQLLLGYFMLILDLFMLIFEHPVRISLSSVNSIKLANFIIPRRGA